MARLMCPDAVFSAAASACFFFSSSFGVLFFCPSAFLASSFFASSALRLPVFLRLLIFFFFGLKLLELVLLSFGFRHFGFLFLQFQLAFLFALERDVTRVRSEAAGFDARFRWRGGRAAVQGEALPALAPLPEGR